MDSPPQTITVRGGVFCGQKVEKGMWGMELWGKAIGYRGEMFG